MAKNLKPIPEPEFLIPSDVPALDFVSPIEERRRDGIRATNVVRTSNFGLLISRFIPHQVVRNAKEDTIIEIRNDGREGVYQTLRTHWFEHLPQNFTQANPEIASLISSTHQRWLAMTEGAARFSMVSRSRMIVGLGGKGALEFGITLHPVTGLPYIPGSALKGLCRNYELLKMAEKKDVYPLPHDDPKQKSKLEELDEWLTDEQNMDADAIIYRQIFGTKKSAGECVFFDAILNPLDIRQQLFELDVMTPHFQDYYSHKGQKDEKNQDHPPHDADKLIPVTFVTVAVETTFSVAVGQRHNTTSNIQNKAKDILQKALEELGIGAKTAAGYGVFWKFEPLKTAIEVGDQITGEVFDVDGDIWFTVVNPYNDGRTYEACIPKRRIVKQRREGEKVQARVVEIKDSDPVVLICEQIVTEKSKAK